ncbi:hypothetical protein TYRP_012724 [Tyrophagus putrescentiae]|nr:hypothetical protein TYRP_012724 [Tyrophagus putrescentiae]
MKPSSYLVAFLHLAILLVLAFDLSSSMAVVNSNNSSSTPRPNIIACRTDHCGGFVGFHCCEGYTCLPAEQCCDFFGQCQRNNATSG